MLQKGAALFVIIICLFLQFAIPVFFKIPCQTMAALISLMWLFWGMPGALISALLAGFFLDVLSFETPFGLFLFSYTCAAFCCCRINRFFFQNLKLTYLLFAGVLSLVTPLIELGIIMIRHHMVIVAPAIVIWNVIIPALIDFATALVIGFSTLFFLSKKRALR
jgi:hypothetical protein